MKRFAELYVALDETNKTKAKVEAMAEYFNSVEPADAAWAVFFLTGRRPRRPVNTTKLWTWAQELTDLPMWLFSECYDAVADLSEMIAKILPNPSREAPAMPLHQWITERLLPLAHKEEEEQKREVIQAWLELPVPQRMVYNKLIIGEFRVGVSQDLVIRALSQATGIASQVIAHRLMGSWEPSGDFFRGLFNPDQADADISRPYPFCLAHPLEGEPANLGDPEVWLAEWKYDGIRAQLVKREGSTFVWSRGEELIGERFPEVRDIGSSLPDGTVIDGEIMAWQQDAPLPFGELQKRIGRKIVGKKLMTDVPVALVAYDLLEWEGQDIRSKELAERRRILEALVTGLLAKPEEPLSSGDLPRLALSPAVAFGSWDELTEKRQESRQLNVEGLMLKRKDSPYLVGRKKGSWWKWKVDPYSVDAVLIYAARGSGIRASLYTDYTFGIWSEGKLVPFAKAYSGLTDEEIREVDAWVRRHTVEKFGPVRTVAPELVFELAFEGIQLSSRHKSGIAVRFPRIARWRKDKPASEADSLETVKALLGKKPPL